jgi:DNA-binding MarR family transcriptional regulator
VAAPPTVLAIWRNLHLADAMICAELNARLTATAGCSLVEHDALAWVSAAPSQRLRMLELAGLLRVTPGGLTRIIDRTVDRGWIERDRPAQNRREVYAVLTAAGRDLLRSARQTYSRVLSEMIAGPLGDGDLPALLGISQKLLDGLNPGHSRCELPAMVDRPGHPALDGVDEVGAQPGGGDDGMDRTHAAGPLDAVRAVELVGDLPEFLGVHGRPG